MGIATLGILLALWSDNWSLVETMKDGSLAVSLISLLIGVVGSVIAYLAVCLMFNRTVVTIDPSRIDVWNGPFPVPGNSQLPTEKIAQISIHPSRGYHKTPCYRLDAISDYGGTLQLFFDQPELKGLQTIERLIERRLNLADRLVQAEA